MFLIKLIIFSILNIYSYSLLAEYYGNAHAGSFDKAIYNPGDMTEKEKKEVNAMVPPDFRNRNYFKISSNKGKQKVTKIKNVTTQAPNNNAVIGKNNISTNKKALSFAYGYVWDDSWAELEYLPMKKLILNTTATIAGNPPEDIKFKFSGFSLLGNGYYQMKKFWIFKFYLMGSLGLGANKLVFTENNVSNSKQKIGLHYGLGLGVKAHIYSRLFLDLNGRRLMQGTPKYKGNDINRNSIKFKSKRSSSVVGLSAIFVL